MPLKLPGWAWPALRRSSVAAMNSGVTQAGVAQALTGTEVSRGRVITKLVCPGRLVTLTVPPCAVVTACTMARPSPVLAPPFERAESPRTNRSNRAGCSSSGMPGPLSVTLTRTIGGSSLVVSVTVTADCKEYNLELTKR